MGIQASLHYPDTQSPGPGLKTKAKGKGEERREGIVK